MTDFAEGHILYTRNGAVHAYGIADGQDTLLLAAGAAPLSATYDTHGLGWSRGATVNFACAGCIAYGP